MRRIAKPIRENSGVKIFKDINWKDIIFGAVIISIFGAIAIPLMVNQQAIPAIICLIAAFLVTAIFMVKWGSDDKLYIFIWKAIRFVFTKTKEQKIDYVELVEKNTIKLKDSKNSCYEFYRILGKDVSLLNEEDFEYLARQLGYFFKDYGKIELMKIDAKINLNKISMYLNSLNKSKYAGEIDANLKMVEQFKNNQINSIQPKYFLAFAKTDINTDIEEKVISAKNALNAAELDLIAATDEEMNDIVERLYFNNINVCEYNNCLQVHYNDFNALTDDEKNLQQNIIVNESFCFRNHFYYLDDNQQYFKYDAKTKEWKHTHNPFENLNKNKTYMRFIAIKSLPTTVGGCWLSSLFNIKGIDVNFKLNNIDIKNLERQLTRIMNACEEKMNNYANSNVIKFKKAEEEYLAYNELSNALAINDEEIKNISCLIKIENESEYELKKYTQKVCKILRRKGFTFSRLQFEQFDAIKEFFANENNGIKTYPIECLDNVLGYGYPFVQQEIIDEKGLLFGLDQNDTPVFIDWKKMDKYKNSSSMILLGKTGSGKSTTTKRIIKNQIIADEYKIYIIDPENEYGDLIESFGGTRILMNDPKYNINPFDLGLKDLSNLGKEEARELVVSAINNKMIFLSTFFRMILGKVLNENDIEWLLQKTNELYNKKLNKEIIFSDLYQFIKNSKDKKHIVEQLGYFCKVANGNKAYIWDAKTTIDMSNHYIVFEFRELLAKAGASAIGTAQIFLVLQFLNNVVLNNRIDNARYINIIFDEAHLLIDPKYLAVVQFMTEMYKRIRKYNGMMTLITQNVSDFYKPEIKQYSTNLINNAFYIITHTIKSQEVPMLDDLMKEQGGLKEAEKEFLTSPNNGQCILIYNKARTKIAVIK